MHWLYDKQMLGYLFSTQSSEPKSKTVKQYTLHGPMNFTYKVIIKTKKKIARVPIDAGRSPVHILWLGLGRVSIVAS